MKSIFVLSIVIALFFAVYGKRGMKELQEFKKTCKKEFNVTGAEHFKKQLKPDEELTEKVIKVLDCIGTKLGMIVDKKIVEDKFKIFLMLIPKAKSKSDEIVQKCISEYTGDDNLKAMESLMKCIKSVLSPPSNTTNTN